jgi:hypothetical protein
MVEQRADDLRPIRGPEGFEHRHAAPVPIVGQQRREPLVADAQESAILEVRLGHPPAAREIGERAIGQDLLHRPAGALEARAGFDRGLHPSGGRQGERLEDRRPEPRDPERCAALERPHEPRADQHRLHEIVGVPGLEGGVLAVVGEAQELGRAPLTRQLAQAAHGGGGEHRARGRPADLRQGHELAEIALEAAVEARPTVGGRS